jgi:uncharacterized protein
MGVPSPETYPEIGEQVGRVAGLWRHPVKALPPEPLRVADVSWYGVAGDRRWGFVAGSAAARGFPWLTLRERPDLVHYRPRLLDPSRPDASRVVVATPSGAELEVDDPALSAELGPDVHALKLDRGTFDASPLSLISTGTVASLSSVVGAPLAVARFRPNLLLEGAGEDGLVGCTLRAGGVCFRLDRRDRRCRVVDVDPATGTRDPSQRVLRAIARERDAHLGVYATPVTAGTITVGDPVVLAARPVDRTVG